MSNALESELINIDNEARRMALRVLDDAGCRDELKDRATTLLTRLDEIADAANSIPGGPDVVSESRLDLWYVQRPSPGVSLRLGHAMRKRDAIAAKREASRSAT